MNNTVYCPLTFLALALVSSCPTKEVAMVYIYSIPMMAHHLL